METRSLKRQKTYGAIQRLIHAWIGACLLALMSLGWIGKAIESGAIKYSLMPIHIFLGYALVLGFVARLVWGIIGPEHARFRALLHFASWSTTLRRLKPERPQQFGHDPLASLGYILLYSLLALGLISGLALAAIKYDVGPFSKVLFDEFAWHRLASDIHEAAFYLMMAFTIIHVAAIIIHEKKSGYPIAQAMLSGYQYRPNQDKESRNE